VETTYALLSGIAICIAAFILIPGKHTFSLVFVLQLLLALASSVLAIGTFTTGNTAILYLPLFSSHELILVCDPLSAFFILVINLTLLIGSLYARGYFRAYLCLKTPVEMGWTYINLLILHISLLLVTLFRDGMSFLVAWELMSITSFFLILFESEKMESREAGIKFLIQMHIALVFILAGFLTSAVHTGSGLGFESLRAYFDNYPSIPLFLLFFVGFGIKAGFIPLHSWLPYAHPAAPSPVSGILSAVIIKMGIYGIVRVLTYIHNDLYAIGLIILVISAFSGILGVLMAIVQHDYKKLLAYHSIENIGIIGIGLGLGTMGLALNNPILATLGFAGGLLHVLNHSLFKSLLFYAAGNLYLKTHTRDIGKLGGLIRKMPYTAVAFLIGAVAISGLPPFNGFISEFLIYAGLFKSLSSNSLLDSFILLGALVSLVVIGGLAVYCFTKVFSVMFLGNERSPSTENASEVSRAMLIPMYVNVGIIVLIGVAPVILIHPMKTLIAVLVPDTSALDKLGGVFQYFSLSYFLLFAFIGILWFVKQRLARKSSQVEGETWGCGYTGANPAVHQYTATSYADYIMDKAGIVLGTKKHYTPIDKNIPFPEEVKFHTETADVFEEQLVSRPSRWLLKYAERFAVFQNGNIQDYLLYGLAFIILIGLLTVFNLI
jgi:formate hydrogenlyase subunit 3/multisubunit Na+/H+ antiporter MnhD subunit